MIEYLNNQRIYEIGEKVLFDDYRCTFKCIITDLFIDVETDIAYATIKPLEFDGFEREVELTRLRKI